MTNPILTTLLNREEAARYLGVSKSWLDHAEARKKGPPFVRLGRRIIRYCPTKLSVWLSTQPGLGSP